MGTTWKERNQLYNRTGIHPVKRQAKLCTDCNYYVAGITWCRLKQEKARGHCPETTMYVDYTSATLPHNAKSSKKIGAS